MQNTFIIGDIHGCYNSLVALLKKIGNDFHTLVFLGDYVDRGRDSQKVIKTVIDLQKQHPRVICLQGNHEAMFLDYLEGKNQGMFLKFGGKETLRSYEISESDKTPTSQIPQHHLAFLYSLPLYWEDEHAFYVHAGFQPHVHPSQQRADWCLWTRNRWIESTFDFGKPVIFGHTTFDKPHVAKNKIGIDTGAVYGGQLSCLVLPDMKFLQVPGEQKQPYPESC